MIKSNIIVFYQPCFLNYDIHIVENRCGKEMASTSYAFKTYENMGGKVAYGSDCPAKIYDSFPGIYCAATRKDFKGFPEGGFYPNECVDVYTAVDAYTVGSAYAQFMENKKGRIKEGQYADIIMIDRDIFSINPMKIKDTKVLLTMVGGKIVYKR